MTGATLTPEQAADAGYISCLLDGNRGIYLPQAFCNCFAGGEGWSGYDEEDVRECLAGPDADYYWDAWSAILDSAEYHDPVDGTDWYIFQDDSLFIVRKDVDIQWD